MENFDDKAYLNDKLRQMGYCTLPQSLLVNKSQNLTQILKSVDRYPVVGKPVRGRGSHEVKVCHTRAQLEQHIVDLFVESPIVMIEEFLAGQEATITVMPPSQGHTRHWSMPPVVRFNHLDDIAPYNGVVAVTVNSRVVGPDEMADESYSEAMQECERVAALIKATAPIRVDIRRFAEGSRFALFDINLKPVRISPATETSV